MTLGLPVSTIFAFLLVLARVAGVVMFLPVPGFRNAPSIIRVVLALALTCSLFPVWPSLPDTLPSFPLLTAWAFSEAGFGLIAGLAIGFLIDGFQMAAEIIGIQAGYEFASTIDPATQADSAILQVMMSLVTGLLFFTTGADRQLIRALAASFQRFPAGSWTPAAASIDGVLRLGAGIFTMGLRVAMPVMAMLLLIDLALALLGRMQQQLNLLSLAFPVKMLAALALLTALSPIIARLFEGSLTSTLSALWQLH